MKKLLILTSLSLMAFGNGWAQSSATTQRNVDRKGASSLNKASKANNSQLKGLGVPYSKDKQQVGKSASTPKKGPIPPSSVSNGPEVSDSAAAKKGITPGSHTAQREMNIGHKAPIKIGKASSKKVISN